MRLSVWGIGLLSLVGCQDRVYWLSQHGDVEPDAEPTNIEAGIDTLRADASAPLPLQDAGAPSDAAAHDADATTDGSTTDDLLDTPRLEDCRGVGEPPIQAGLIFEGCLRGSTAPA